MRRFRAANQWTAIPSDGIAQDAQIASLSQSFEDRVRSQAGSRRTVAVKSARRAYSMESGRPSRGARRSRLRPAITWSEEIPQNQTHQRQKHYY